MADTPEADRLARLTDQELIQEAVMVPESVSFAMEYGKLRGYMKQAADMLGPLTNNGNDADWLRSEVRRVQKHMLDMLDETFNPLS